MQKNEYTKRASFLLLDVWGTSTIKTSQDKMKTIAILALTAAALVSCQQQQQQQVTPAPTPEPAPVAPIKK